MPTLNVNVPTLLDIAKTWGPDGKPQQIIELLAQTNEILQDMGWIEANGATSHRSTMRTGLPSVAWRLLNSGVQPSKSVSVQVDEGMGIMEAWSEVDKDLAELNGNVSAFRLQEAGAFIESMNQEMAQTLFYGNSSVSPEEFTGLAVRYSALTVVANSQNVINGAGTGADQTSIWLVGWSPLTITGIYPKGSKAGLTHNDLGVETVETTNGVGGARMRAYREQFQWKCGVALRDWRYVVRIANIDVGALVSNVSAPDLRGLMIRAIHRIPHLRMVKPVFYMNRTAFQYLDLQRLQNVEDGGGITYKDVDGQAMYTFRGIPIRVTDALLETEAQVT